ncbi:MAG: NIP7 N-terminal domain-related protein [Asgard group archaeon]|nr:NIP7 N-terminal domain-related protein [Asgard group archaeon]
MINFRKPTNDEKKIIIKELNYWVGRTHTKTFLEKFTLIIAEGNWKEALLVEKQTAQKLFKEDIEPYTIGLGLGEFKKNNFLLGLPIGSFLVNKTTKKAIVSKKAEQLFLYQNNLYCQAFKTFPESINKNDKLLIINQNNDFLGIGKLIIEPFKVFSEEYRKDIAVINLIDLGWYLRKGK